MENTRIARASINIDAYPLKVWEALTTPELIKQYFFGTDVSSDWMVGSPIVFSGQWQGKPYQDKGKIVTVIPNKLFKYSYWSSLSGTEDKPENYALVTYDLSENKNRTVLVVTQTNIPNEEMQEHCEQNWGRVLADLRRVVEKEMIGI